MKAITGFNFKPSHFISIFTMTRKYSNSCVRVGFKFEKSCFGFIKDILLVKDQRKIQEDGVVFSNGKIMHHDWSVEVDTNRRPFLSIFINNSIIDKRFGFHIIAKENHFFGSGIDLGMGREGMGQGIIKSISKE
jgi:hypothetical protein